MNSLKMFIDPPDLDGEDVEFLMMINIQEEMKSEVEHIFSTLRVRSKGG